jgi:O-antigen/teichoic acid export membrane protein
MSKQPASSASDDLQTLAKGGRTNTMGFVVRLLGNAPFLFIGYRLYGVEEMGRFAFAFVVIEIIALICALGEKRGLAQRLTEGVTTEGPESEKLKTNLVFDGMSTSLVLSSVIAIILLIFPSVLFPNGMNGPVDLIMIAAIPAFALTEILLAAQAYKYDIATTVRARAIVEPWTKSILAGACFYLPYLFADMPWLREGGLAIAFTLAIYAGLATAAWSFLRTYGLPVGWRPDRRYMLDMGWRALPLVGADVIERGTRLIDLILLGIFTTEVAVGIYFFAKEIASLPQKLKSSFEPILSPVITKNLKNKNYAAIAAQIRQVGFWIIALQAGIALALAIPGEAVMGLGGPAIVGGTGALALLLAAEVAASMAVVSESVLIYMARKRNLLISSGVIGLQTALTIAFIAMAEIWQLGDGFKAAGAALALLIALGTSSIVKARFLNTLLGAPVSNWRKALAVAAAPALAVGFIATLLPEWLELILGIPAILATYGYVIWKRGFGEEDRVLFRKNIGGPAS